MLNWRIEEEIAIKEAIKQYNEEQAKKPFSFLISERQERKNIEFVTKRAIDRYRLHKLEEYEIEIQKEREKIDNLIKELNIRFNKYLHEQGKIISDNVKPIKLKTNLYETLDEATIAPLEVVTIYCEPFRLSFIQEKLGSDNNAKIK